MNKSIFLIFISFCCSINCFSQTTINPEESKDHIGESVIVCGKIFGGKFLEASKNQPTFLNMGAAYPKQQLTIVIWGDVRNKLGFAPEEKLKDKIICVSGKIEEFKGKTQIVIYNQEQLKEN